MSVDESRFLLHFSAHVMFGVFVCYMCHFVWERILKYTAVTGMV